MSFFEPKTPKNQEITLSEQGSAIIWVLVMVVLFAALTLAVSDGSRTGTTQISDKQAELAAVEILDYARNIKNAVHQLQINGCSDTEISFENAIVSGYSNPNSPSDKSCDVFNGNGGGMRYKNPEKIWLDDSYSTNSHYGDTRFSAHHCVVGIGSDLVGCPDESKELLLNISFLKQDICKALNKAVGLSSLNDFSTKESSSFSTPLFNGTYGPAGDPVLGDQVVEISGKTSACTQNDVGFSANAYIFHYVLIAR